jgi:hypothetical protein
VRGRDRQNQVGFTLGGPLFIPNLFNTKKDKLFFFVSEELWRNLNPSTTTMTVPTELDRQGDFSPSPRANDVSPVTVLEPLTGRAPFPGNLIPRERWNKDMVTLMNMIPLPNYVGETTYNFRQSNTSGYSDKLIQNYRIDYNATDRWRVYFRFTRDYSESGSPTAMASFEKDKNGTPMGWQVAPKPDFSVLWNVTTIISPTFTNELVMGGQSVMYYYNIDKGQYLRKNLGLSFSLPYPQTLVGDYGPYISFGGTGNNNMPRLGTLLPYHALAHDYNIVDNLTKVYARHTLKTGFTYELNRKDQDTWSGTNHAGRFEFNRDTQNPMDTDYQFANFLTGTYQTFN